jgi:hypothetical protein
MTEESPLSDELTRLFGAVSGWARENFPAPARGMEGSTCEWCPLCQFMAVVRGERPELTERVAEAGAVVLGALRTLAESTGSARPRPRPRPHPHPRVEDE